SRAITTRSPSARRTGSTPPPTAGGRSASCTRAGTTNTRISRSSRDTSTTTAKRCVLNVSTSRYVPFQKRLVKSLTDQKWTGRVVTWAGRLPTDSPPHEEAPYAFKLYAVAEATKMGFTSVLWLDSICMVTRPLDPIFKEIEHTGHCFVSGDERLGNWASDDCLRAFAIGRDQAMKLALLNGAFIGLDLEHTRTREWF